MKDALDTLEKSKKDQEQIHRDLDALQGAYEKLKSQSGTAAENLRSELLLDLLLKEMAGRVSAVEKALKHLSEAVIRLEAYQETSAIRHSERDEAIGRVEQAVEAFRSKKGWAKGWVEVLANLFPNGLGKVQATILMVTLLALVVGSFQAAGIDVARGVWKLVSVLPGV